MANANLVGFGGSMVDGQATIKVYLRQIFIGHPTTAYVGSIRGIRSLAPDGALAARGCRDGSTGQADLIPAANTIQTLTAVKLATAWCITLSQNTPAQFHGRPDLILQLTDELRQLLR